MVFVFLDVDGTVLPFAAPARSPLLARAPLGSPLVGGLDPELGGRLMALPRDLVWATTWMQEANEILGPLMGAPVLPVLDWPERSVEDQPPELATATHHPILYALNCRCLLGITVSGHGCPSVRSLTHPGRMSRWEHTK